MLAHYHKTIPKNKRSVKFHADGDVFKDAKANGQIIQRMMDGSVRMPVEIEESLIEALPIDWRKSLKAALAARMGLLASPIPSNQPSVEIQHVGQVATEFGELFALLGKAYNDGALNEKDAHLVDEILKEVGDLMAIVNTIMQKAQAIKSKSNVHVLHTSKESHHV